ncbi:response regulator [Tahibacter amnicola]|uniref:histidine kinase n=1 Tax=Tahibacter amnicola TaxID=2976241 RepID=A0ABY6B9F8_9GAMM|nr:response regulator [Tahibacter amnicola]UXI66649.1 response regulator [Tahibacter amnicola]
MSEPVLIVDDSLTVRMDLVDAFEAAGYQPIACGSVAEAQRVLAGQSPAVVILDVVLPDGDGITLLGEIRAREESPSPVVLMLSTEAEVRDRIRGLRTGADEYVGKPYDSGYVVAKVRELLRTRDGNPTEGPNVLLIDDSATFRHELATALTANGYSVRTAASGEEGLRAAADQPPGVILVDGVLPGIDGATVIRRLRLDTLLRSVPAVLLTGSEGPVSELRALEAGADAYLRKDEDLDLILAKLDAVVRSASTRQTIDSAQSLLGPKKVLAVDDSLTFLHEMADSLRSEGYEVILAHSGEEALDLLAVQSVDCILLDLIMPGLGGEETCRRIKSTPMVRDVPLILLTALEDRTAMVQGLAAGADDYIAKSSDVEILKARIRAQLRRKQFEDENRRIRDELLQHELAAAEARAVRELAAARAVLVDELEQKNRELEAFSYSVSHDLRGPLRVIDGLSQACLEDYGGRLEEEGRGYLQRVCDAARRMGELIDDLLALSWVGRTDLRRESVDLSTMARGVADELRRKERHRQVTVNVEDGLVVEADSRLMRIVLENLLGNAWKFTSRTDDARIDFGTERLPDGMAFRIRDNGAGFDMAFAEKLFRPFQRLHDETQYPGTGIGLATIQRIIDRHGGITWATGEIGRGATLYFTLPEERGRSS